MSSVARDRDWFLTVLEKYEMRLTRYAFSILGDRERARDAVQETFLKLFQQKRSAVENHVAPWLFTVCRNQSLDIRKKEHRMVSLVTQTTPDPKADSGERLMEKKQTTNAMLSALGQLKPNEQEVIRLKFQSELSYREIAEITGLSESNVGFLIHTGIKKLRKKLQEKGGAL